MDQDRFDKGLATRRDVLGAEYVDNALAVSYTHLTLPTTPYV